MTHTCRCLIVPVLKTSGNLSPWKWPFNTPAGTAQRERGAESFENRPCGATPIPEWYGLVFFPPVNYISPVKHRYAILPKRRERGPTPPRKSPLATDAIMTVQPLVLTPNPCRSGAPGFLPSSFGRDRVPRSLRTFAPFSHTHQQKRRKVGFP